MAFHLPVSSRFLTSSVFRGSLSKCERKAYTDAVLCFQKLPAKTPRSLVPGARSRYDDFLATHINQTLNIHYTVGRRALESFQDPY